MKKKTAGIIVIMSFMAIILCGCSTSPKSSADTFLKGIQTQDLVKIATVYDVESIDMDNTMSGFLMDCLESDASSDESEFEEYEPYLEKLFDFDYEILNENINGNQATVDVRVTAYNYGEALKSTYSKTIDQSIDMILSFDWMNIENTIEETVMDALSKAEKNSVLMATLELEKKNGRWVVSDISENEAFLNALTGGLYDAIISFSDDWFE